MKCHAFFVFTSWNRPNISTASPRYEAVDQTSPQHLQLNIWWNRPRIWQRSLIWPSITHTSLLVWAVPENLSPHSLGGIHLHILAKQNLSCSSPNHTRISLTCHHWRFFYKLFQVERTTVKVLCWADTERRKLGERIWLDTPIILTVNDGY